MFAAKSPVKRVSIEMTVIRADGRREELGIVSDSRRRWNYGPGRLFAWYRIQRANRRIHG